DTRLSSLPTKLVTTQPDDDQALNAAGQAVEKPKATHPAKVADGDNTVNLGKGIKFGYDRVLYTQFKDKFQLKIRIRLQFRFTDSSLNSAYGAVGDPQNYPIISGQPIIARQFKEDVTEFDVRRVSIVCEGFAF